MLAATALTGLGPCLDLAAMPREDRCARAPQQRVVLSQRNLDSWAVGCGWIIWSGLGLMDATTVAPIETFAESL